MPKITKYIREMHALVEGKNHPDKEIKKWYKKIMASTPETTKWIVYLCNPNDKELWVNFDSRYKLYYKKYGVELRHSSHTEFIPYLHISSIQSANKSPLHWKKLDKIQSLKELIEEEEYRVYQKNRIAAHKKKANEPK